MDVPDLLGVGLIAAKQTVSGFRVQKSRFVEWPCEGFFDREVVIGGEDDFERLADSLVRLDRGDLLKQFGEGFFDSVFCMTCEAG